MEILVLSKIIFCHGVICLAWLSHFACAACLSFLVLYNLFSCKCTFNFFFATDDDLSLEISSFLEQRKS